MLEWWDFLWARTAEQWQAIGSVGTLAIATLAAAVAGVQAREARQLRIAQSMPEIVVDFETQSVLVEIAISNTGQTTASDVKVAFDPPLESTLIESGRTKMLTSKLLTEGIETMPPGKKYRLMFEHAPDRYKRDDLPRTYTATATYRDTRNKRHAATYVLDFDTYYGYNQVTLYDIHDAAKALKEMQSLMKKWAEFGQGGLRVFSRDGDAKDRRMREEFEEMRRDEGAGESEAEDSSSAESSFVGQIITRVVRRFGGRNND
ncbi:hypothetical protein [Geodermatophilus sp. CPCC 205506]|uniref:hypothetical protein n=1 Tax=Geodermatophilus sp. CPCC 205506 TaxID=2936596 RepID=UPI003EEFBFBB